MANRDFHSNHDPKQERQNHNPTPNSGKFNSQQPVGTSNPQLKKMIHVHADLICISGVRVGASKETMEIGGIDNPILRDPFTHYPYLPGSSLKGKMRSLIEAIDGKGKDGNPCGCAVVGCRVCTYFGPHKKPQHSLKPTRFLFRDASLQESSKTALRHIYENEGLYFTEVKSENTINRTTHVANSPRTMERVPAGTRFDFHLDIRVYVGDDEQKMRDTVNQMLRVMNADALGGSGSRGSGQIRFDNITFTDIEFGK